MRIFFKTFQQFFPSCALSAGRPAQPRASLFTSPFAISAIVLALGLALQSLADTRHDSRSLAGEVLRKGVAIRKLAGYKVRQENCAHGRKVLKKLVKLSLFNCHLLIWIPAGICFRQKRGTLRSSSNPSATPSATSIMSVISPPCGRQCWRRLHFKPRMSIKEARTIKTHINA